MDNKKEWFELDTELYQRVRDSLSRRVPNIKLEISGGRLVGRGEFPVLCNGVETDSFEAGIFFPENYPKDYPKVVVFDPRIPTGPNLDWHIQENNVACLSLNEQIWEDVGDPKNIERFLDKTVNDYFIQQTSRLAGNGYLGEWGHYESGRIQFYALKFPDAKNDPRKICKALAIISAKDIKGHHPCPFCSKNKIRDCHIDQFKKVQAEIRREFLLDAHSEIVRYLNGKGSKK